MARIGLFGGSFNPVHVAHLIVAEHACDALELDRVIFIPAKIPPHKDPGQLAGPGDRLRMLRLAIAGNERFSATEMELRRRGKSYTIDTVRAMRSRFGPEAELYFLIGADMLNDLPTWRCIRDLARLCAFVPVPRPGARVADEAALAACVGRREARAILGRMLKAPRLEISASLIRSRVAAGRSIRYLVPDPVIEYIRRRRLYQPAVT